MLFVCMWKVAQIYIHTYIKKKFIYTGEANYRRIYIELFTGTRQLLIASAWPVLHVEVIINTFLSASILVQFFIYYGFPVWGQSCLDVYINFRTLHNLKNSLNTVQSMNVRFLCHVLVQQSI